MESTVATHSIIKEEIAKAKDKLKSAVRSADVTGKRVKFAMKVTEDWLKETLTGANFEEHSSQGFPYRFWHGGDMSPLTKSGGVSNKQEMCIIQS